MYFVMSLPKTQASFDAIWLIVDRLTKFAHFLPIRATYPLEKLAQLYVQEIVRLHEVPSTIISYRTRGLPLDSKEPCKRHLGRGFA